MRFAGALTRPLFRTNKKGRTLYGPGARFFGHKPNNVIRSNSYVPNAAAAVSLGTIVVEESTVGRINKDK